MVRQSSKMWLIISNYNLKNTILQRVLRDRLFSKSDLPKK